jgi:hypothetical protein
VRLVRPVFIVGNFVSGSNRDSQPSPLGRSAEVTKILAEPIAEVTEILEEHIAQV